MKTRKNDEDIRLLWGQVSAPHKKLKNLEIKLDKKSDTCGEIVFWFMILVKIKTKKMMGWLWYKYWCEDRTDWSDA